MAKSKKRYNHRNTMERLDSYTEQLLEWIDTMENKYQDDRRVTTVVTKHGTVLVQVR